MIQTLIKKFRRNRSGFTLIELIVVIAILGILAAVLIPTVTGVVGNARKNAEKADIQAAYMAAQMSIQNCESNGYTISGTGDISGVPTGVTYAKTVADDAKNYAAGVTIGTIAIDSSNHITSIQVTTNSKVITYAPAAGTYTPAL